MNLLIAAKEGRVQVHGESAASRLSEKVQVVHVEMDSSEVQDPRTQLHVHHLLPRDEEDAG